MSKMADVEAMLNAKLQHKTDKPADLAQTWRKAMFRHEGEWGAVTIPELSMLRVFAKACPPGGAQQVLRMVLNNWGLFCKQVQVATGTNTRPYKPSIAYLTKYREIAMSEDFANLVNDLKDASDQPL